MSFHWFIVEVKCVIFMGMVKTRTNSMYLIKENIILKVLIFHECKFQIQIISGGFCIIFSLREWYIGWRWRIPGWTLTLNMRHRRLTCWRKTYKIPTRYAYNHITNGNSHYLIQIEYPLGGSSKKSSHVYFLLIVAMVLLLWRQIVLLWHQITIVASEQHLYQTIVQFDKTIVLPTKLATGSIHDYLFCYCPLVNILFEVLRIVDQKIMDKYFY